MKLLSSDTTLEAQRFLVGRLKSMPLEKKYAVTAAAIQAGFNIHRSEAIEMNPFDVAHRLTRYLEQEAIDYFLGGSIASTTYGEPRFTQDVDVIVRLSEDDVDLLVAEFESDFYVSGPALHEAVQRKSSANLIHLDTNFKIDLIVSRERPFEKSRFERRVRKSAAGQSFWFCTAEDIVLVKLEWYKNSGEVLERQLRDVQTVLMVQESLDLDYLRKWAVRLGVLELLERSIADAGLDSL